MTDPDRFVKHDPAAPAGFFEAEARGLRWLAQAPGGVRVVGVVDVAPTRLVLDRLQAAPATKQHADDFGARLARTHLAGAPVWGSADGDGFIGPLPLPNGPFDTWPDLWWDGRVLPYLRRCADSGRLAPADVRDVERAVASTAPQVPAPEPARIHGDLWSGNVVWTSRGAVLIDAAAAHGGHPEADLAMLALFGCAHLERVLHSYQRVHPLADGWRERVSLFWLHPLLVHVVLFGGHYIERTRAAVRSLL